MMLLLSRRTYLGASAGIGAAAGLWPLLARATPSEAQAVIDSLQRSTAKRQSALIAIEAPEIAENGNTVPIGIIIDSPMTAADHVQTVHLIAEANPLPVILTATFTPAAGVAAFRTRIRLAQTQTIRAVAVFSDQSTALAEREIKVTIGGCGG